MRRKRGGPMGSIIAMITGLIAFGIFLAVLAQFGGDLGALFQWLLNSAWQIVVSVRDSIASWDTFQRLF